MIVIIVGFSRQARQRKRESETERINKEEEEETDDFGRKQWTGLMALLVFELIILWSL